MAGLRNWRAQATLEEALAHGLDSQEFATIKSTLGRDVNVLEVGICAALFSEHCSYKSTKVHLRTLPTTGPRVLIGPGENAGVLDIGDGDAVAFKVESHNHPSFIEPFQGAATGVGGILRDVFTMGARPLVLMNALRFGALSNSRTKYLASRAVSGIGHYGNCMGVPTVGGELFFHESYNGNCLVNAFALGVVKHDKIFRGNASGIGNPVMYVGSKTGRDGIHGATMASESFDDDSEEKRPTVQVGDPFQEKLLLEACLEVMQTGAVVGIQDMGAAGMTSSTYEMAERAGSGVRIHLDRVPQREDAMDPYEIMLSESQERMLLVAQRGKEDVVREVFERWGLDVVEIGEVIAGEEVELFWKDELVSSISATVLASMVPQHRWPEEESAEARSNASFVVESLSEPSDLAAIWLKLLANENLCSRAPVYSQYDSTVRSNTVVHPGGDAAVIRLKPTEWGRPHGTREKGLAVTLDCNSRYCAVDPRRGTAQSVAEAFRNITSVGAEAIGISNCLNFGDPQKPEMMWFIAEAIRGLGEAARAFSIPIISGNVSLYNETRGRAVFPTPLIAMVGLMPDANLAVDAYFKNSNDTILVLGDSRSASLGSSEFAAAVHGVEKGAPPTLDYDTEIRTAELIRDLVSRKLINSCHDISSGGLALALSECCFGAEPGLPSSVSLGAKISSTSNGIRSDTLLFGEGGARYIISLNPKNEAIVRNLALKAQVPIELSGSVGGDSIEVSKISKVSLEQAHRVWRTGLMPTFFGKSDV